MTNAVPKKKSTIYDIANETNLSIATVSRILNRKGSYSRRSAGIVMEAAKKLGYAPGNTAFAYEPGSSKTISLYFPKDAADFEHESYFAQFMLGASEEAISSDYGLLLCRCQKNTDSGNKPKVFFDPARFSALVVPYFPENIEIDVEAMLEMGIPVSYAGQRLSGDMYGNNIYGGYIHYKRDVLELLYSRGYRNILVFEMFHQVRNLSLIESFRRLLEEFRIEKGLTNDKCRLVIYDKAVPDHFQILLQSIMDSPNRPEVLFTDSVDVAVSAYNIIQKAGLNIPEDIGIISASHFEHSGKEFLPMLTTVWVNAREMGRRSIRLLVKRLQEEGEEVDRNVPYKICIRDSIGFKSPAPQPQK